MKVTSLLCTLLTSLSPFVAFAQAPATAMIGTHEIQAGHAESIDLGTGKVGHWSAPNLTFVLVEGRSEFGVETYSGYLPSYPDSTALVKRYGFTAQGEERAEVLLFFDYPGVGHFVIRAHLRVFSAEYGWGTLEGKRYRLQPPQFEEAHFAGIASLCKNHCGMGRNR